MATPYLLFVLHFVFELFCVLLFMIMNYHLSNKKKIKNDVFVCFETNLMNVPNNSRWLNFGSYVHVKK